MASFRTLCSFLFLLCTLWAAPATGQTAPRAESADLGTIAFATSGTPAAQAYFLKGALALHSFWYPQARDYFQRAQRLDPGFAMAYWGEAMTHDHPLWDQHDNAAGRAVLARLDSVAAASGVAATPREERYLQAVRTLFMGEGTIDARRRAHADAMVALRKAYPSDDEAAIFAALARMSLPSFSYEEPSDVVPIAADLEAIYQRKPRHPGVLHYLIHVYDSALFAPLGLRPAQTYAKVAPAASHALHMPSHIYRSLGRWTDVIPPNVRAYQASVDWQQRTGRPIHMRDFHSYRWLFDAYVALNRPEDACQHMDRLQGLIDQAQARDESTGRMPEVLAYMAEEYQTAFEDGSCAAAAGTP
ncbi:hypothetical protein [Salisaeta longa]|uniref:hypothetical protein n=1 Tax=Salisaeta longa TaxID=503170 RepID=UPI0003B48F44|nr:hypothetical protein [Salisaeta longa]